MLLSSISNLSTKEVFLKVKEHLLLQNAKSASRGDCVYLNGKGLKCAVGCLMSDEDFNNLSLGDAKANIEYLVLVGKADGKHVKILRSLQKVHDKFKPARWERELDKIEQTIS